MFELLSFCAPIPRFADILYYSGQILSYFVTTQLYIYSGTTNQVHCNIRKQRFMLKCLRSDAIMTAKIILNPYSGRWKGLQKRAEVEETMNAMGMDFDLVM